ncbi:Microtubule-nucleating Tub4p (gamma-tubulin) complex component [Serendipita sp. 396]|nr:Microtubule-nucleating Tub4p (gamma-tubulin) complex component [Serendipita sp. 396]KAG8787801.1 Microtubule-nucleating Tub4p (gamma-tubulin) complex component [Serendipita sp. 397]KAG8835375.1 Microtubule-nucleating Tub4p (gamma-tubulin) complex component [Serendipita sp. 400]KAG8873544.1 Microtubule-nucleating Tub4p (gamma-tubulin) complex component [Serendipita sp. 405]
MASGVAQSVNNLILTLVPASRGDEKLRAELFEDAMHILNSHIGSSRQIDAGHISATIRSRLSAQDALRFSNLLARLLDQDLLARKHAVLQFMAVLTASPNQPAPLIAPLMPSMSRSSPSSPHPRSRKSSLAPPPPIPIERTSTLKSKAQLLREYRLRHGRPQVSESVLLRDALYLLQGISGKIVRFVDQKGDGEPTVTFSEDPRHFLPAPTRALILRLSELGHLYQRVSNWVRNHDGRPGVGMIEQSLCHHLQSQLTEYYRLIAVLESQMSQSSSVTDAEEGRTMGLREEESGLTLRRLEVWVDDWRLRMRMMSVCVEGCQDTTGGALVSLIYGYTDNGDPFVRGFTDQLLEEVSKPFFQILQKWLFAGELHDPFSEFFVAENPELAHIQYTHAYSNVNAGTLTGDGGFAGAEEDERNDSDETRNNGLKLWEGKYEFRKEMLPSFVGETFGRKIFSTGKSLSFIRYSCHDTDWVATRSKLDHAGRALKYSDLPGLVRSIDSAYQIASQRLLDIFLDKFKLLDHLRALKSYLLLGRGDFADQLMDSLLTSLSRPANTLYRHNLTATLEAAVRASNARFDPPDVLRRLDARMLEYSHGEIGWDVFTLEYKVDAPIDTVIDPDGMEKYLKIFHHLWRMKRVEGALSASWNRIACGARSFLGPTIKGVRRKSSAHSDVLDQLEGEWHQIRIVLSEMIHFMRQLQAFCQLEVIECSWKELMDFVNKKEGDLDGLVQAHRNYLDRMVKKILLMSPKLGKEEHLLIHLRELFNNILQFRDAAETLYNYCLAEAARADSERDHDRGVYTMPETDQLSASHKSADSLPRILRRVKEYSGLFSERAQSIVHALQVHQDLDCRFLSVRLNFSDFYRTRKELKAALEASKGS